MAWFRWGIGLPALIVLPLVALGLILGDFRPDDPGFESTAGRFVGDFRAVSDTDMAATAYADGALEPLAQARDTRTLLRDGRAVARAPAPNSVISWPQGIDVSRDGTLVAVVETRGAPPPGTTRLDHAYSGFPEGSTLTLLRITPGGLETIDRRPRIGVNPQSVEFAGPRRTLVIASAEPDAQLVTVVLAGDGTIASVQRFDLDPWRGAPMIWCAFQAPRRRGHDGPFRL